LNWPGMTMNFTLADSLTIEPFSRGQAIEFALEKGDDGQYQVVDYRIGDTVIPGELWLTGEISMLMADFGMITLK
ncbi:copper-binding protein, partial [Vibrio fluvialis]|nr:copper-binding protein [Vibrio fluvialis]